MDEFGGLDVGMPDEGQGGVSEEASEAAKQRFAGTQAAMQQLQREEKKAKKRDDGVAKAILQFLTDAQRTHLAALISHLVALNCPSPFILAILSLINDNCKTVVEDYLRDHEIEMKDVESSTKSLIAFDKFDPAVSEELVSWIERMELVFSSDEPTILRSILVEDRNIDGTVLQLTTFVLQAFLQKKGKNAGFEQLQQLSIGVLQSLFGSAMQTHMEHKLEEQAKVNDEDQ